MLDLNEIGMRALKEGIRRVGHQGRTHLSLYPRSGADRLTLVAGVPTFDHGELTGRYPGEHVGPEMAQGEGLRGHRSGCASGQCKHGKKHRCVADAAAQEAG